MFPAVGSLMLVPMLADTAQKAFDAHRSLGGLEHFALPPFLKGLDYRRRLQEIAICPAELGGFAQTSRNTLSVGCMKCPGHRFEPRMPLELLFDGLDEVLRKWGHETSLTGCVHNRTRKNTTFIVFRQYSSGDRIYPEGLFLLVARLAG